MNSIERRISRLEEKVSSKKLNEESAKFLDFDNNLMTILKKADYSEDDVYTFKRTYKEERLGICASLFSELVLEVKTYIRDYKSFLGLKKMYCADVHWYWRYVGSGGTNGNSYTLYCKDDPFVGFPKWVTEIEDIR